MNKSEIKTDKDVLLYLNEHFHHSVNAKRNRGGLDRINFEKLIELNEILKAGFLIDISSFYNCVNPVSESQRKHFNYFRYICYNFLRDTYKQRIIAIMLDKKRHDNISYGLKQHDLLIDNPDFLFKPFNDQFNRVRDELGY